MHPPTLLCGAPCRHGPARRIPGRYPVTGPGQDQGEIMCDRSALLKEHWVLSRGSAASLRGSAATDGSHPTSRPTNRLHPRNQPLAPRPSADQPHNGYSNDQPQRPCDDQPHNRPATTNRATAVEELFTGPWWSGRGVRDWPSPTRAQAARPPPAPRWSARLDRPTGAGPGASNRAPDDRAAAAPAE